MWLTSLSDTITPAHCTLLSLPMCVLLPVPGPSWKAAPTEEGLIILLTLSTALFKRDALRQCIRQGSKTCWHSLNWRVKATVSTWHSASFTEPAGVAQGWFTFVTSAWRKETTAGERRSSRQCKCVWDQCMSRCEHSRCCKGWSWCMAYYFCSTEKYRGTEETSAVWVLLCVRVHNVYCKTPLCYNQYLDNIG